MPVGLHQPLHFFDIEGLSITTTATGCRYRGRDDLVLFGFPPNTSFAACFTQNAFAAAPVQLAKQHLAADRSPQFWLINAGNANAATGTMGLTNARKLCSYVAARFDCSIEKVLPFSTGVIGEQLPVDTDANPFASSIAALAPSPSTQADWHKASKAILTTDTIQKGISMRIPVGKESFVMNGIAKGSGMICPNMATMLAFIVTDLAVSQTLLQHTLSECLESSFNAISVDGDTSTNDAVAVAATGTSSLPLVDDNPKLISLLREHLQESCNALAQMIVRDGEGITKLVCIEVSGANTQDEAKRVASCIAHSPLVKTALFASDPNWGRIACAIGNAGLDRLDTSKIEIWIDDLCIMRGGVKDEEYTEAKGQHYFAKNEIWLKIVLGRGQRSYSFYTTDLSHEYVTINSNYRS